jgi:hypothetical protein
MVTSTNDNLIVDNINFDGANNGVGGAHIPPSTLLNFGSANIENLTLNKVDAHNG